jgi:hypothetical protein
VWRVTETAKTASDSTCQPPASPLANYSIFVTQSGNNISAVRGADATAPYGTGTATTDNNGVLLTGTLSGGSVSLSGTNPDGTGSTTSSIGGSVAATCNSISAGTQTFSYSQTQPSAFSCTGTITYDAARVMGSGCGTAPTNTPVAEVEPNNTAATAQAVTLPAAISGTTSTPDQDWYSITLTQPVVVTAMLVGPSGTSQDIDVLIYDNLGVTVLVAGASFSSREAVSISLQPGTYKVRVNPFNVTGSVNYTLTIQ